MSDEFFLDAAGVDVAESEEPEVAAVAVTEAPRAARTPAPRSRKVGSRASGGSPLYFDIETIPDYERLSLFGLPPVPEVPSETDVGQLPDIAKLISGTVDTFKAGLRGIVAPSAWLDQLTEAEMAGKSRAGILSLIEAAREVRQTAINAHADRCKLLSTTPEYCKVAALGWAVGGNPVESLVVGQDGITERDLLETFWDAARSFSPLVGFNVIGFDIPVILVRSAILGVPSSKVLDLRPWGNDVVDIYLSRFGGRGNTDRNKPGKLKALAPLYGIVVPADDVDGSQVDELMRENPAKVAEYVQSDVSITRSLHQTLAGYFWK